ncbi:DUF4097 family beta strand repeat-containing protein [Actinomadura oligospora]|uniref:DUF4097 family beta strand repeat-containing protein n=1 Tax=Actinomadura oligospora TaxID=111804 RepID=UPI00047B9E6E|nr:DUF4097 family beta strand repeat-containing protein [Actinomadura oligospora]
MTVTDAPRTETPDGAVPPARPRRRRPWLALAALTTLFVAVPAGLEIAGVQLAHDSETSEALPSRPLRTVEIDATSAAVTVQAGTSSGPARLRKDLHWMMAKPRVRTEWDGDTLTLRVVCGNGGVVALDLCDADVTLSVPSGVAVRGRMTSGTLAVRGVTGPVDVHNNSGTLQFADLTGPLRAQVSSGSIQGERVSSAMVEARSGSGAIDLAFAKAPARVIARTGSGSIEVGVPVGSHYRITGDTNSGSRDVAQGIRDDSVLNVLDLSSGSGSVTVHY